MVFVRKLPFFKLFLLGNIGQENVIYDILDRKTPFQPIETRSSKCRKVDIFPKGLTHGFGAKMAISPTVFFLAIWARKMSFMTFQNEKTPFQAIKTRTSKNRKVDNFKKELTHGVGPKMAIFENFFFRQYRPGKCLLSCSSTKTRLSRLKKKKKLQVFFLANISLENVFYVILERKNAFLGYKKKKFKNSKK